ncbi:putative electron transfer flavoprotein subunit [Nowakowskiella sp. JEL0078]|nr:putative electron transfer flavoprotein subunit [Nowakowskiella sp. JEL0078]
MSFAENSFCLPEIPRPVSPHITPEDSSTNFKPLSNFKPDGAVGLSKGTKLKGLNKCANCGTNETPLWRRGPMGEIICNACGLWLKSRNNSRPTTLKTKPRQRRQIPNSPSLQASIAPQQPLPSQLKPQSTQMSYSSHPSIAIPANSPILNQVISEAPPIDAKLPEQTGDKPVLHCVNCDTTSTPLWRRDERGNTICNACGLYFRLHNTHRPTNLEVPSLKRRKRVAPLPLLPATSAPGVWLAPTLSVEQFDKSEEKHTIYMSASLVPSQKFTLPPIRMLDEINEICDLSRKRDYWKINTQAVDSAFGSDGKKKDDYGFPIQLPSIREMLSQKRDLRAKSL